MFTIILYQYSRQIDVGPVIDLWIILISLIFYKLKFGFYKEHSIEIFLVEVLYKMNDLPNGSENTYCILFVDDTNTLFSYTYWQ